MCRLINDFVCDKPLAQIGIGGYARIQRARVFVTFRNSAYTLRVDEDFYSGGEILRVGGVAWWLIGPLVRTEILREAHLTPNT